MFTAVDVLCWFVSFCVISAAVCVIHLKAAIDMEEEEDK